MRFFRFVGFTFVRAWQGFWRNAMMSLAATGTVILMLVLLAGLLVVITGLNAGLEFIESKVGVTAQLADGLAPEQVDELLAVAGRIPGVASVEYVSPEVALERLRQSYRERGQELDTGGAEITLYASLELTLEDPNQANRVARALERRPEVELITTQLSKYEKLIGVINTVRNVGLLAVALVGVTVLFMIVNMVRIAVYARAGEIEIMRLVGASDAFIRWPFILEGMLCGLVGAAVAIGLVALAWGPIQPVMVTVFQLPTAVGARFLATLALTLLAVGVGIATVGSWISVRSYLSSST